MERFVHKENIALYRRLISESELAPSRDENRHKMLLTLLAEEMAKDASAEGAEDRIDSYSRPDLRNDPRVSPSNSRWKSPTLMS
jgi:hypothetical protein